MYIRIFLITATWKTRCMCKDIIEIMFKNVGCQAVGVGTGMVSSSVARGVEPSGSLATVRFPGGANRRHGPQKSQFCFVMYHIGC